MRTREERKEIARQRQQDLAHQEAIAMHLEDLITKTRITVFLGKNGAGKSTLLRQIDGNPHFVTNYITPERGGVLKYDPAIEGNVARDENWMMNDRRKNRTEHFRQQSATQFRNLEVMVLREIEQDISKRADKSYTFDNTIQAINELLPAISIERADRGFKIYSKKKKAIEEDSISSGESELIALAIEVLVFSRRVGDQRVLLMDEPDVHLHPDLQQRFIKFVEAIAEKFDFRVVIATHSTAIIGAFSKAADVQIVPITSRDQTAFQPFNFDPICHEILPVFGAHPLSSQFNRTPPLLVEGDDDRRVLDQIVRSGGGKYMFAPCVVGTVSEMSRWEAWLSTYLPAIYDAPVGYSLRDLDSSGQTSIGDLGCVVRSRLNCYAIENVLLTEECFAEYGHDAASFLATIQSWLVAKPLHQATPELELLAEKFDDRRTVKIKDVRNVLVALLGIQKPWEIVVANLILKHVDSTSTSEHSVATYLGNEVRRKLFGAGGHVSVASAMDVEKLQSPGADAASEH